MEDKDKIASFIANHNIIRPIEYPLIAMPFLTTLTFVFYTIFYIVSSDKTSGESVLYIVGVIFSIITFVFSMWMRRKYLKAFNEEPGKSMYAAEAWQYTGFVLHTSLLMLSFFFVGRGTNKSTNINMLFSGNNCNNNCCDYHRC